MGEPHPAHDETCSLLIVLLFIQALLCVPVADILDGNGPGVSGQPVLAQPGVAQQVQDQAAQLKQVSCQSEESPPVTLNSPSDHTQLSLSDFWPSLPSFLPTHHPPQAVVLVVIYIVPKTWILRSALSKRRSK